MRRETISAIRFGFGRSPQGNTSVIPKKMVADAQQTASVAPRLSITERASAILAYREARKQGEDAKESAQRKLRQLTEADVRHHLSNTVADAGFGARLLNFWSDHFTVAANGPLLRTLVPSFIDDAIRPNLATNFPEMLRAATFHPAMLVYLNQVQSVGPNSRAGQRRDRGLNENLAREILELHTLGVSGSYAQTDVRAFAELLTGLSVDKGGFIFRAAMSEPGPHRVLSKEYGAMRSGLDHIEQALNDIALHPETARHLASKLVMHFVGVSDPDFEMNIAAAYLASNGDLQSTYLAMLDDDRAWRPSFHKAKLPFEFIVSALRAAGASKNDIEKTGRNDLRQGIIGAMQLMGQPLFQPPGPDGWSEEPSSWVTAPGLASRIRWATAFAERIEGSHDPREFLETTLADAASPVLQFAVSGAESRVEGIALTLVSPEFNRR